jgi:foldase protein PrsA
MRSLVRRCGIMIAVVAVAGMFAGCAQRRPSAGPVPPLPALASTPEDRKIVVAKVNGAEINRYSLIDVMNYTSAMNERASISESREEIRKKALDRLIFEELAVQEARRRGLVLKEGALDRAMGTIRTNLGDEEAYKNYLAKQGISEEELRSQVERILLLQLIVDQEVIKKAATPDDAVVRKEYERQKDRLIVPGKVSVDDVVLFLDQNDPASMTKANGILARISAAPDKDPGHLAPDGTFIVQHVDLDAEKEPALYDAARKLKEGELSGVIRASDSLHIIRLTMYAPERQRSYEEVKGPLEAKLKTAEQRKRRQEWERDLRAGAVIEILDLEGRKTD